MGETECIDILDIHSTPIFFYFGTLTSGTFLAYPVHKTDDILIVFSHKQANSMIYRAYHSSFKATGNIRIVP